MSIEWIDYPFPPRDLENRAGQVRAERGKRGNLLRSPFLKWKGVGFMDDDPAKPGLFSVDLSMLHYCGPGGLKPDV